ncbi:DNA polymerase Y family protein [Sphingomonas sp.]|uniref:Y-family DNA polymerase n=1 Tax=Sphingomonas sp. TaxID=28214 RepID=UPI0025CCE227|nr:DNA polymerase Y family protein [Sphingomonas sp.]
MQRVAALFLPSWPIDRLRRAERRAGPPEPVAPTLTPAPRNGGWRPGARWAREDAPRLMILPGTGRGTAPEGRGGGGAAANGSLAAPPLHHAAHGPPPRAGEDLIIPLITAIREGSRIEIAAACPHALALGLRPGMAVTQARAQVRGLDIRPADPEGDRAELRRLALALARRWTPTVAIEGEDTLFLDLTGVAHLHGGEARMAARLVRLLTRLGFAARIAIADTPGAAWGLAHHYRHPGESRDPESKAVSFATLGPGFRRDDGILCKPCMQAEAMASLPVDALRIEGKAIELLHRLGVTRVEQLAAMPRGPLAKRFGKALVRNLERALGRLPEPLDPVIPREAIVASQRFAEPIATPEAIAHWLGQIVTRLAAALEAEGLGATRIELIADRIDGVPQRIRMGLARPSRDAAHILRLLTRRIEEVEPGYGIDAMALHVRRADRQGPQPVVERLDEEAAPDLAILIDTLATRIGMAAMWRSTPVESDVPERSVAPMGVLDSPGRSGQSLKAGDIRQLDRNPALHPWHPEWPKPARLLRRPERIDHVMAELPDHAPRRFTWRGTSHRVVRADGPERVHGEWWKRAGERDSVRDYFRVEDDMGCRYWLFRKGDGERPATGDLSWYLHGVFG